MPLNQLRRERSGKVIVVNYGHILDTPVPARYAKYKSKPRQAVCVTEVRALKFVKYEPFDIRIALPDH
ncbi:MAG: hypothetical protein H8E44_32445 [Planctomycetes bacterium]|nr:hypothetical protein [Planctomycetota bacterium]MBL7037351.1 hypothetical protein [Pirellulaceae bacterium]